MKQLDRIKNFYYKTISEDLLTKISNSTFDNLVEYSCVILHVSSKEAVQDKRKLIPIVSGFQNITGQIPLLTIARASIASFRLKKGMEFGVNITLKYIYM
jgi:large subunit ribosomal protein L5